MIHSLLLDDSTQLVQAHMLASPRPIPVAAVFEDLLVDRFQNPLHRQFDYFVLKTANS
jgi:hypothetical protein